MVVLTFTVMRSTKKDLTNKNTDLQAELTRVNES